MRLPLGVRCLLWFSIVVGIICSGKSLLLGLFSHPNQNKISASITEHTRQVWSQLWRLGLSLSFLRRKEVGR